MQARLAGAVSGPADIDYEQAAENLQLPKDFSKFLK